MLTIRVGVIATAAAFLALPSIDAQARDCERYPAACEQPAEAKVTTEPTPRATPVQKRKARAAKRPAKSRIAAKPSRVASRQQPAIPAAHEPPARLASYEPPPGFAARGTTTLDAAVMLPQPLADAATALAMDWQNDRPAPAAAGAPMTLPTDDAHTGAGLQLASPEDADVAGSLEAVRFVDAGQVNEIDLAVGQAEPAKEPTKTPWVRYLLAMMGAALAAASTVRFFSG